MTQFNTTTWKFLGAVLAIAALGGCDEPASGALDERLTEILERIEDPRSYEAEQAARALLGDLEQLTTQEEALLVAAIDELADDTPVHRTKSAKIPVAWANWPSGKTANGSGITTQCGNDNDIWLRYSNIQGAFASPGSLRIQTNSIYAYGAMAFHNYLALAFKITSDNTVNICVGTKGLVGPAVQGALISGFFLK